MGSPPDTIDQQIDKLVHEFYGLTDDEIAIIEGTNENLAQMKKEEAGIGYQAKEEKA